MCRQPRCRLGPHAAKIKVQLRPGVLVNHIHTMPTSGRHCAASPSPRARTGGACSATPRARTQGWRLLGYASRAHARGVAPARLRLARARKGGACSAAPRARAKGGACSATPRARAQCGACSATPRARAQCGACLAAPRARTQGWRLLGCASRVPPERQRGLARSACCAPRDQLRLNLARGACGAPSARLRLAQARHVQIALHSASVCRHAAKGSARG